MGTIPCSMFYVILVLKPTHPTCFFPLFVFAHFYIISLMILDMLHSCGFCFVLICKYHCPILSDIYGNLLCSFLVSGTAV